MGLEACILRFIKQSLFRIKSMLEEFLLFTNLSLLILHEMDAVFCKEWRMLIFLNRIQDSTARIIFSVLHLPLFVIILFLVRYQFQIFFLVLSIFSIFHLIIHFGFRNQKVNGFKSKYSNGLIVAMGIVGFLGVLFKVLKLI